MERFTISKSEKQTIYEIYRACRLCGAGGGYRMPIIQNLIDLETTEVELTQKIRECLQVEVRPDDRMPPLICEICVDKLNDFYEFLELTRQTNVKTRTRLGLPMETAKKGEPEPSNCILGVTEPVYVKEDVAAKKSKAGPKCSKKIKQEPEVVQVKVENTSGSSRSSSVSSRAERPSRRAPSPPLRPRRSLPAPAPARAPAPAPALGPATRRRQPEKETRSKPESKAKETHQTTRTVEVPNQIKVQKAMQKELATLLQDSMNYEDNSLMVTRTLKRALEEPPRPAPPPKRAKPATKEPVKEPVKETVKAPVKGPVKVLVKAPVKGPAKEIVKGPAKETVKGPAKETIKGTAKETVKAAVKEPVKEPSPARSRPGPKSRKTFRSEPPPEPENVPVPVKMPRTKPKMETPAKLKEVPKPAQEPSPPLGPPYVCVVCDSKIKNAGAFVKHMRIHVPCFTKLTHACNPCGKWFSTVDEASVHHRYHRAATFPYHCYRCFDDFRTLPLYDDHIDKGLCVQDEPPRAKCDECCALFASEQLRAAHRCPGGSGRPGGKCSKCSRTYATAKNLKRHESQCVQRKAGDLIADPDVLRRLKPMRVRISRCDELCARAAGGRCDVSRVKPNYGLAKNYIYPYMKLPPVKSEPLNRKRSIPVAFKEEPATDYTHWDSDDSDSDIIRRVPSLFTLAIKKLFSKNLLGKVPRKRKKVKNDEFEDFNDVSNDINDYISSLGDVGNGNVDRNVFTAKIKDIIGCLDDSVADDVKLDEINKATDKEIRQDADVMQNDRREDIPNVADTDKNSNKRTKELESNERVDNDNCEVLRNVEEGVNEESKNVKENANEESTNVEASIIEELNKVKGSVIEETSVNEESTNVEASITEELNKVEGSVSEETSVNEETTNVEASITEELNKVEGSVSEETSINQESTNVEASITEELNKVEGSVSEETSVNEEPINEKASITEELYNVEGSVSAESNTVQATFSDTVLHKHSDDENDKVYSVDMEIENFGSYKDKELDVSLQKSKSEIETRELENMSHNGINHENENAMEVDIRSDSIESKKNEEIKQTKESPIKHSIENLIGETDRNPDKYIKEVISSIEDIIMNNPRPDDITPEQNELSDKNLMDALDEQIGEKIARISDSDKITLEDLLPKENRQEELEDISDEDFNFDA